jgi:pyridoxine kinase
MSVVLILGSHVASSRVGGTLVSLTLALSPFEIEPIHVPTTLLGRHPGLGAPGGGPVSADQFGGMLEGVAASGLFAGIDAVITNYFASPEQVVVAGQAIDAIKAANPNAIILVDPVMGDAPKGLYVDEAIAASIVTHLVPRADILTPNLWELGAMTGFEMGDEASVIGAARSLGTSVLVTSFCRGDQIGCLLVDGDHHIAALKPRVEIVPKGTGDLLAAFFLGHVLQRETYGEAMKRAVAGVAHIIGASHDWGTSDLPIVGAGREAWASTH